MSTSESTATGNGMGEPLPDHVKAERVEINQGGVGSIDATTVSVQQGGAARVRAHEMSVAQGGVALARTDKLHLEAGASAFGVVAGEATFRPGASVFVLIARNVVGDVRPIVDWRAVAAFGVALGLVISVLRRR